VKVTLLCKIDFANVASILAESFRKVGINAIAFSLKRHKFKYTKQATVIERDNAKVEVEKSDVVVFVHSLFIDTGVDLGEKIVAVYHTGSQYRKNAREVNQVFNKIVDVSFCGGDVLNMGAKNEMWVQPPIDTEFIKPVYKTDFSKFIIGHFPSGGAKKGCAIINEVLQRVRKRNFEFNYNLNHVPWTYNLKRMSECDIYIEDMHDKQGDKPLYVFGMQALEAACLGKVVCTRFPMFGEYEKTFGPCSLIATDTPEILQAKIEDLLSLSNEKFVELQKRTRKWVEDQHSYEVVGNRFKKIFEEMRK